MNDLSFWLGFVAGAAAQCMLTVAITLLLMLLRTRLKPTKFEREFDLDELED